MEHNLRNHTSYKNFCRVFTREPDSERMQDCANDSQKRKGGSAQA